MAFLISKSISKSAFLRGLQCHKRLWYEVHQPQLPKSPDQSRLQTQGNEVGQYAHRLFPQGQSVSGNGQAAINATQAMLTAGATCLFEAAFNFGGISVRCDVLQRNLDNTWNLIEVKSSTGVKNEHYWDVAIQQYVVERSGLGVNKAFLMHINHQDCYYPDLSNLFVTQDITAAVAPLVGQVASHADQFRQVLAANQVIKRPIGKHCHHPQLCPFQQRCWQQVPEASIFTIPRFDWRQKQALIDQGVMAIAQLPATVKLSAAQSAYVQTIRQQQPRINRAAIATQLARLTFPIHFFDFETFNPAIPRFPGTRPYQQIPCQYSCHRLDAQGTLTHHSYLHTEASDPRLPLLASLVNHIGPVGSVVVYHQAFEISLLKQLAQDFPAYQQALVGMCDRIWDLEAIFKHAYQHPAFLGSTSLKKVLPVLAPHISYQGLTIQQGEQAQMALETLMICADPIQKKQLTQALADYCRLDTLAMVEIYRTLIREEI